MGPRTFLWGVLSARRRSAASPAPSVVVRSVAVAATAPLTLAPRRNARIAASSLVPASSITPWRPSVLPLRRAIHLGTLRACPRVHHRKGKAQPPQALTEQRVLVVARLLGCCQLATQVASHVQGFLVRVGAGTKAAGKVVTTQVVQPSLAAPSSRARRQVVRQ